MTRQEVVKRLKHITIRDASQEDYDALYTAIDILNQYKWNPANSPPKEDGEYLVSLSYTVGDFIESIEIAKYANNLYKVDEHDFYDKNCQSGWYQYSGGFGYFERYDVVAWMPLPKHYNKYKKEGD